LNSSANSLDSNSSAASVTTDTSGMSCACGPACKCGSTCKCQPGATIKFLAAALLTTLAVSANSLEVMPSADSSMHTEGTGAVTVVFESGLGDTGKAWHSVQSSVAARCAKTVSYTRRGYGTGNSAEGLRDAEHIVAELRQRLAESDLPPPYVLVGHSSGGLYMQYFARRYPTDVQGLVLVDSMHWDQLNRVKAAAPGVYRMDGRHHASRVCQHPVDSCRNRGAA
jgi:pimeloyl-ACP methyl ester carboxylesterase